MSHRVQVLVVLGLLGAIVALVVYGGQWAAKSPYVPNRVDAQIVCQGFVKEALRSPASAVFSNDVTAFRTSGDTWIVNGWVDAQNGFGANIRNNYECRTTYTGTTRATLKWSPDVVNVVPR